MSLARCMPWDNPSVLPDPDRATVNVWCNQPFVWRFVSADTWVTSTIAPGLLAVLGRGPQDPMWTVIGMGRVIMELRQTPSVWRFSPDTDEWHTVSPPREAIDPTLEPIDCMRERNPGLLARMKGGVFSLQRITPRAGSFQFDGRWAVVVSGDWPDEDRYWLFVDGVYVGSFDHFPWKTEPEVRLGCLAYPLKGE
jgi:hypothetical protein